MAIRKSRLRKMLDAADGRENIGDEDYEEFMKVIIAAEVEHDKNYDEANETEGCIQLPSALEVLEEI